MKKFILSLALSGALVFAAATETYARGVIFYSTGEKLEITRDLPEDFTFEDGTHMNLGVKYNQFSIFWIPVWNYGETTWAYVNDARDTYSDEVTPEELEMFKTEYGIDVPEKPVIGFWNRIGGKLVWLAVILALFGGTWYTKAKNIIAPKKAAAGDNAGEAADGKEE